MPLLEEHLECLRESGRVLYEVFHVLCLLLCDKDSDVGQRYECSVTNLIASADGSAARLVNILARDFSCFRDEHSFPGREKPIRLLKRAQILVADLWACFQGESYGTFRDIDKITMFADYRVPQILISLGSLYCSPSVATAIKDKQLLKSGSSWEVQLRGELAVLEQPHGRLLICCCSMQYMVRGADPERNPEASSRHSCECHFDRLLLVRQDEGTRSRGERGVPSSQDEKHMVLDGPESRFHGLAASACTAE